MGANSLYSPTFYRGMIFPLKKWLIKPYPGRNLNEEQKIYNYLLSPARRK